uniref:Tetratricopeptide repeat protein n=1 Tax=Panagrolaimus davidi TaxID=227884 RepID=A0A914QQ29_9BILA
MTNGKGLNQEAPVSRRSRNPEEALLLWKLQYLQMHGECNILPTKKIIFPSKSHFCKMPFEKLEPIKLCEMKVPMVHNGKFLVAKVIGKPFAVIGVNALIEDLNGDVEEIALYNFRYNFDNLDWIGVGIILIIKEPWLRYSSDDDTPSLWVDSPSDVIFVDPTDDNLLSQIGANQWHVSDSKDVDVIRKMANNCFIKKDYDGALMLYDRAIRYKPDLAVLYLNKSLTCLKIGAFYMAYNASEIALEKGGDREKAMYRMGQSAYRIHEWQKAAEHFANVCKDFPKNAAAPEQLKRAIARLNEKQTGKFDFKSMYLESKKENPEIDVADYQGPIKIVNVNKKGILFYT